ncbi:MAG: hypothetical protein JXB39_01225 [Deltaproteobacteria bacterium]|nr:hypothetical protein [Deltaproteobacteria bacterium]
MEHVWLSADIRADETAGDTFFMRSLSWRESHPEIAAWRERAMDLLPMCAAACRAHGSASWPRSGREGASGRPIR